MVVVVVVVVVAVAVAVAVAVTAVVVVVVVVNHSLIRRNNSGQIDDIEMYRNYAVAMT